MDFPLPLPPEPPPAPPTPAPTPDPVWSGIDVVLVLLFTAFASLVALVVGAAAWAVLARVAGWDFDGQLLLQNVPFLLAAQTAAFAAGLAFAALWIGRTYEIPFLRAVHWRAVPAAAALGWAAVGVATSLAVSGLSQVLPIPKELPIDQLFGPRTAWLLVIYGIGIAPFFEEMFFRGLIFPSLEAGFRDGLAAEKMAAWRALTRVLAGFVAVIAGYWLLRAHWFGLDISRLAVAWLLVAFVALALPAIPVEMADGFLRLVGRWGRPRLAAIVVTGVLFGLAHGVQLGYAWAAVLLLSGVGMLLTYIRAQSGSVVASWLFHCAYNTSLFAALYITTKGFHDFSQLT